MKKLIVFLSIFSIFLNLSCSKSGKKALQQGDYYTATLQAIEKLNRDADNSKSRQVLSQAYRYASEDLLNNISADKQNKQPFVWERVVEGYEKLNTMYARIEECRACQNVTNARAFYNEADEAIEIAAKERYAFGMKQLQKNTRESARDAFDSFDKLYSYAPDYQDVAEKREEALNLGSFHVVVEQPRLNARLYDYSYEYFQSQVEEYLNTNRRLNKFVRFYNPSEAEAVNLRPDHVVKLEFIDFVVGQTKLESKEKQVTSTDSVKTGTAKVDGKNVDVYGLVNAKVTEYRKQVHSHGVMLMQIVDYQSRKTIFTRELVGEFDWFNEWVRYNGDERALTKEQLAQTRNKEELPPPPQQLFIEFSKPIHNQFTSQIQSFYRKY